MALSGVFGKERMFPTGKQDSNVSPTTPPPTYNVQGSTTYMTPGMERGTRIAPGVKAGRKPSKLSKKFNRCVKSVRKTVKARKGSNPESAAIAICTTSVLQTRGKTLKRYRKGRVTTQRKFRGGDIAVDAKNIVDKIVAAKNTMSINQDEKIVEIPEAKDNPAIDDIIQKLKGVQDSKSALKRLGQALVRQGGPGETEVLVDMLTRLKTTGQSVMTRDTKVDKLTALYPMM
jgi:hypothetical protein